MNIAEIKRCACADGPGIRVAVYVSGCRRGCKNCQNSEAQSFTYGRPWTTTDEAEVIRLCQSKSVHGLSLLGGEPFEPENQRCIVPFLERWRSQVHGKDVWCWTGAVLETQLQKDSPWRCECTDRMLELIDYLVDGPYIEEMRDLSLKFRGSSNQRIIRLHPKVEDVTDKI